MGTPFSTMFFHSLPQTAASAATHHEQMPPPIKKTTAFLEEKLFLWAEAAFLMNLFKEMGNFFKGQRQ